MVPGTAPFLMTALSDPSRLATLLAQFGFSIHGGEALVLVGRRPASVLWASDEALARFEAADGPALADRLFRHTHAAVAFAARLARLTEATPYRLERLSLAGHPGPVVIACHPVEDGARPLALLHVRSSASAAEPLSAPGPIVPRVADVADPDAVRPITRILWETDAIGMVTGIGAEARFLGSGAPRIGDDLPARLREVAPTLSARIARAAQQGGSVGLVRFAWPVEGLEAPLMVEAGCAAPRGDARGLRGFFAVHGGSEPLVAAPGHDAEADRNLTTSAVAEAAAPPPGEPEPVIAAAAEHPTPEGPRPADPAPPEPAQHQLPPGPPIPGVSGNVVHFPIMRLGPVPANFVPALRPAPPADPVAPEIADLPAPHWSEAPSADPADQDSGGLSASERDAFEHIRKVLGTRPFAPPAPERLDSPAAPGLPPGVSQLLDRVPVGLRLDAMGAAYANAALRDRLGPEAATALPGQNEAGPRRLTARDGTPLAAEIVPFDMGGTPATLTILPAEDAVRMPQPDAMALTPEVLDLVTDGHLRLDETGAVLDLSPKAAKLLGIEARDALGRPFASFLSDGQAPSWQALAAAATGPESQPQGPSPLRLQTKTDQPLAVLARLGRSSGTLVCALTLDRPAAVPANDTAEVARREAERTSALKSEFLAKVSHEIRTPLNAILGFAELIRDERLGPVGNARYLEYMRDIHASGTHVMSLVNDLLDLSRIEAGRMDLNLQAVDANGVVQGCVNTLQTQAHRERVVVRLSLTPRLPPTLADERSLRQIVLNLVSNAIKFNEPGGQVIVSTALAGPDAVAIRIRDTGIGMSEDEIAAAMEPFRQLSTVNRTGSGLGLPLTKALVEANCASMSIKSTRGEGTLVEVSFPLVESDSVSLPAE